MDKKKVDAQFVKEMPEKFDKGGTCHWLSKNNSYIGTEALYALHRIRSSGQSI